MFQSVVLGPFDQLQERFDALPLGATAFCHSGDGVVTAFIDYETAASHHRTVIGAWPKVHWQFADTRNIVSQNESLSTVSPSAFKDYAKGAPNNVVLHDQ